ncbi:MAG: hypothetical protein II161_02845, partial [Erysipelotrichaceae bacterium]|nr:hypothetical protein [Erysipelotrichaceae bacterium]
AGIEVQPLKTKYPQGGEKQIIKAITGREVPSGKLPIETGCVVVNVASTFAIYEAVQKNKPLIERIVTVTGKSVPTTGPTATTPSGLTAWTGSSWKTTSPPSSI